MSQYTCRIRGFQQNTGAIRSSRRGRSIRNATALRWEVADLLGLEHMCERENRYGVSQVPVAGPAKLTPVRIELQIVGLYSVLNIDPG